VTALWQLGDVRRDAPGLVAGGEAAAVQTAAKMADFRAGTKRRKLHAESATPPALQSCVGSAGPCRRCRSRETPLARDRATTFESDIFQSNASQNSSGRIQVRPLSRVTARVAREFRARLRRYFPASGFAIFFFFFFFVAMFCFLLV
jgi:hypothetical protein